MAELTLNGETYDLPNVGDSIYCTINGHKSYREIIEIFAYDDIYQIVVDNNGIEEIIVPDIESTKYHYELCYKEFDN